MSTSFLDSNLATFAFAVIGFMFIAVPLFVVISTVQAILKELNKNIRMKFWKKFLTVVFSIFAILAFVVFFTPINVWIAACMANAILLIFTLNFKEASLIAARRGNDPASNIHHVTHDEEKKPKEKINPFR